MSDIREQRLVAPADIAVVEELATALEREGRQPFGETTWRGLHGGGADSGVLLTGDDGRATVYVHLSHHHADEWALEAGSRPGSGDALTRALVVALEVVGREGGGHASLWLHGPVEEDENAAVSAGLVLERELHELRVALPLAEEARWPAGTTVRSFVPGRDEEAWVEVNNRAFAGHPEQGNWTTVMLKEREAEPWFDADTFVLAEDHRGLAGFNWTKLHPAAPPSEPKPRGEIYVIGVDPSRQGAGFGRALAIEGLARLARRGATVGMLYVDAANDAALALYRSLGFVLQRIDRAFGTQVEPG
jgi:mycothiol synthase